MRMTADLDNLDALGPTKLPTLLGAGLSAVACLAVCGLSFCASLRVGKYSEAADYVEATPTIFFSEASALTVTLAVAAFLSALASVWVFYAAKFGTAANLKSVRKVLVSAFYHALAAVK